MIKMSLEGDQQLTHRLKQLSSGEPIVKGMRRGATYLKGRASKYPPKKRPTRKDVYGKSFESDRQRKFFFAALRRGQISVPYIRGHDPRSERHKQSWTTKEKDKGLTQVIGSDTSYGPYLQDEDKQSKYMQAVGWKTVQDIMKDEERKVISIVRKSIDNYLRRSAK